MGLRFERAGRRITKLEEVIELMKAHFDGSELDCDGEFVHVRGYAGRPRPVQRPHPPIMVGGGGKRVLTLAARKADIVTERLISRREELGINYVTVQQPQAEAFAPVVARLRGL
jgi:alkanesulfonate monooxygenase SsuD/methylene tetrahydromethanopterin reductase-like flavin-dependent oxidoreductase (luciferase family)